MIRDWLLKRRIAKSVRLQQDEQGPPDEDALSWTVSDWAPEDLLLCGKCGGHGAIRIRTDWESGSDEIEACPRCPDQRGLDPAQVPEWAVRLG